MDCTVTKAIEMGVPEHTAYGIVEYINNRRGIGDFLQAVMSNDLFKAFVYADDLNAYAMSAIVKFIYNHTPSTSHGSEEAVNNWLTGGGGITIGYIKMGN